MNIAPPITTNSTPRPPRLPAWPKVIGIISIVYGSLCVLTQGCGLIATLLQGTFQQMLPQMNAMAGYQVPPMPIILTAIIILSLILDVFLIVAGVALLHRKAHARNYHVIWASLSIALTLINIYPQVDYQRQTMAAMQAQMSQQPGPAAASSTAMMSMQEQFMIVGLVIGILINIAYPSFCLFWFALKKKRPEHTLAPSFALNTP